MNCLTFAWPDWILAWLFCWILFTMLFCALFWSFWDHLCCILESKLRSYFVLFVPFSPFGQQFFFNMFFFRSFVYFWAPRASILVLSLRRRAFSMIFLIFVRSFVRCGLRPNFAQFLILLAPFWGLFWLVFFIFFTFQFSRLCCPACVFPLASPTLHFSALA